MDTKTYYTHDNGGRPFKVEINGDNIKISKANYHSYDNWDYEGSFLEYNAEEVFIGKSPKNKMTEFSGGHGSNFDGNSILLKMSDDKYIYIGESIFSFKPLGKIVQYMSPVGNSDVPYPYAIDEERNFYLMIEGVIVKGVPLGEEPYDYYYKYHRITKDLAYQTPKPPVVENFWDIVEYHVDDDQYTFTYHPNPEEDYDDALRRLGSKMYIVKTDGIKYELTKEMYVELMKEYGDMMGFQLLETELIQKRL